MRNFVGALKADALNVLGEPIRIFTNLVDGRFAVEFVNANGAASGDAVRMKEDHDLADETLLDPRVFNFSATTGADSVHFFEARGLSFDHVEDFLAEMTDQLFGVNRANAFDHAAAEIFFDAFARSGRDGFGKLRFELQAVFAISDPMTFRGNPFPSSYGRERRNNGDKIAMAFDFDAQNAKASFLLEDRDPLDQSGNSIGNLGGACSHNLMREIFISVGQPLVPGFRREWEHAKAEKENGAHRYASVAHRFGIVPVNISGQDAKKSRTGGGNEATDVVTEGCSGAAEVRREKFGKVNRIAGKE